MSSLPGTVPRMMRPAPGQNYPRTGFPLEGRLRGEAPGPAPQQPWGPSQPHRTFCEDTENFRAHFDNSNMRDLASQIAVASAVPYFS